MEEVFGALEYGSPEESGLWSLICFGHTFLNSLRIACFRLDILPLKASTTKCLAALSPRTIMGEGVVKESVSMSVSFPLVIERLIWI